MVFVDIGTTASLLDMRLRWVPRTHGRPRRTTPCTTRASQERKSQLTPTLTRKVLLLFVVGDILGAGIYALTGKVAAEVGGAIWTAVRCAPFVLAGSRPRRTRRARRPVSRRPPAPRSTHNRAFKRPFLTFMIAFAVMMSGITSASAAARAFGGDYLAEFVDGPDAGGRVVLPAGDLGREPHRHLGVRRRSTWSSRSWTATGLPGHPRHRCRGR